MSTVSERIKQVRMEATGKKMSREAFAEALHITSGVVANWEDAENRLQNGIPERSLRLICETFHINFLWLNEGKGQMMEDLSNDTDALVEKYMAQESPLTKSIMKAFAKLPDEEWIRLRDMIDRIKKEGSL